MNVTSCCECGGRGYLEKDEHLGWVSSCVKSVCLKCLGRGCDPVPANETDGCPNCNETILVGSIVPKGTCYFCGAKLRLLPPKCILMRYESRSHTLFHDNTVGAGVSVELGGVREHVRGPCIIRADEKGRIFFPGDVWAHAEVIAPDRYGSFRIEVGRIENRDGEIVKTVCSMAEVVVTKEAAGAVGHRATT